MSKKNQVDKNLSLTFDFIKEVVKNPSIIESVEDLSELMFTGKKNIPVFKETSKISLRKKLQSKNKSTILKN
ncbi:MAG: hypothetical protein ABIY50_05750 [Ignavibacteria bacterium]